MKKAISLILLLLVSVIFVSCDMKNTKDEKTIAKKETINEKVKKSKVLMNLLNYLMVQHGITQNLLVTQKSDVG